MDRVSRLEPEVADSIAHAAIQLSRSEPQQTHLGVLHREKSQLKLLHLPWHNRLQNELAEDASAVAIELDLPALRLAQVAGISRLVWRENENGGVPYAFSAPVSAFGEAGDFQPREGLIGLTCATFVMAVFSRAGLDLIDATDWPEREEDTEWQERMLQLLAQFGASEEHTSAVRGEVGSARYRPEEVAAAGAAETTPARFDVLNELVPRVLAILDEQPE